MTDQSKVTFSGIPEGSDPNTIPPHSSPSIESDRAPSPSNPLLKQRRQSGVGWSVKYKDISDDKTAKVVVKCRKKIYADWKKKAKNPDYAEDVRRISRLIQNINVEEMDINSALIAAASNASTTFEINLFTK